MDILRRKAINLVIPLLIGGQAAFAESSKSAAIAQYEAVEHDNIGCPENSECDQEMGKLLSQWKKLAERWQTTKQGQALYPKELTIVTTKRGWPAEFYARPAIRGTLAPVLYTSSCAQHRSKNPAEVLMRGLAFMKGVENEQLIMTKGETEYRLKIGEVVFLQTVIHFPLSGPSVKYYLPLDEKPLYMENDQLVSLVESEDLYSLLKVNPQGQWSFSAAPSVGLSEFTDNSEEVPCPKEAVAVPTGFAKTYCQKISNSTHQAAGIVQLFWACL